MEWYLGKVYNITISINQLQFTQYSDYIYIYTLLNSEDTDFIMNKLSSVTNKYVGFVSNAELL